MVMCTKKKKYIYPKNQSIFYKLVFTILFYLFSTRGRIKMRLPFKNILRIANLYILLKKI